MIIHYKSYTSNAPECSFGLYVEPDDRPELKGWGQPHWEIYVDDQGNTEVWACRPTEKEIRDGDLHGKLGSIIKLQFVNRATIKNALSIARSLCLCTGQGAFIKAERLIGIAQIETDIPLYSCRTL